MTYAPLIVQRLPEEALLKLGCYVQTCAHIEQVLWFLYYLEDPASAADREKQRYILSLKLKTDELIKALERLASRSTDRFPEEDARCLKNIIEQVKLGLQTRANLVHGAYGYDPKSDRYIQHSHWKDRKGKGGNFVKFDQPLPISELDAAINIADNLLRDAEKLLNASKNRNGF